MVNRDTARRIGGIENYHGVLVVKTEGDKFFWAIECHSSVTWEEIPKFLYESLIKFEEMRVE
jgi:hypothetical protein